MGKQSKRRKSALRKAKQALRDVVGLTKTFYNDTRMSNICAIARVGHGK